MIYTIKIKGEYMIHSFQIELTNLDSMNLKEITDENHISLSKLFEKFASDLVFGEKSNGGNQRDLAQKYLNSCQYDVFRDTEEMS